MPVDEAAWIVEMSSISVIRNFKAGFEDSGTGTTGTILQKTEDRTRTAENMDCLIEFAICSHGSDLNEGRPLPGSDSFLHIGFSGEFKRSLLQSARSI